LKNSERSFILKVQKDHHVFFKQHKTDGVEKRIQYLKKLKKLLEKSRSRHLFRFDQVKYGGIYFNYQAG